MTLALELYKLIELNTDGEIDTNAKDEIDVALRGGNLHIVRRDGKPIGFLTVFRKGEGRVLVNNLCILKQFRSRDNLLYIRKYLKNIYTGTKLCTWENAKKNKEMIWNL